MKCNHCGEEIKFTQINNASIENVDTFVDGTVILDSEGEAWQKWGSMWYLANGGYLDKGPADFLPVTVLTESPISIDDKQV